MAEPDVAEEGTVPEGFTAAQQTWIENLIASRVSAPTATDPIPSTSADISTTPGSVMAGEPIVAISFFAH